MITKESLVRVLTQLSSLDDQWDKHYDEMEKIMGVSLLESKVFKYFGDALDLTIKSLSLNFEHPAIVEDVISWFIFEHKTHLKEKGLEMTKENAGMFDDNNTPFCYDIDSLADYILEH